MEFTLNVEMDNEAFTGAPGDELARILRRLAVTVGDVENRAGGKVRDFNGNTVGAWEVL